MRLGFLGTGHITEAMVTGFCTSEAAPDAIAVSPRNAKRAASLAERFPQVTVAADNQAVIDQSDLVVLALVPQTSAEILAPLRFRAEQLVVSAMALCSLAQLSDWLAPAKRIVRIIPMPPIARHMGPIALCPPEAQVAALFDPLGQVVAVENEDKLNALFATTAMMAPFYAFLEATAEWLVAQDVSPPAAKSYIGSLFHALAVEGADQGIESFAQLVAASQTAGGINEQALRQLREDDWDGAVPKALALVLKRLQGQ